MTINQEEKWLLEEKYKGAEGAPVFNESLDEIKSKYSWGEAFRADLIRLRSGTPLAYLIGHVPFLNSQIHLDSHPLIPRLETEYWVEKAIMEIISSSQTSRNIRVLDLCAGSGCVGVAAAKAVPEARVTFAEIDPAHLPTIQKNLAQNLFLDGKTLEEQFEILESDLFQNISGKFDFILSNPPYIDPIIDRAEASVKAHEPSLALYGGQGGMEVIKRIIVAAPRYLAPEGQLWLEHEPEQTEAIKKSAEACGFRATTHPDQYGIERFSILSLD